ncbi:hypothetical protein [Oceanirhabdus sp. W0125-5]|uniref:hypothetical protein n=1 Tax=Oceanirhabdus sp. W0125-5 TaxID=2999116 RepID=UPI0022F33359|nr:hypothetical protein [Oceanirhabdus sp. W0125-5]WBW99194.1 hypothetical protein OW730_10730 [Oceanirhabdus sp. W0125-5]
MKWVIIVLLLVVNVPIYIMLYKRVVDWQNIKICKELLRKNCAHKSMVINRCTWIKGVILVLACFLIVFFEFNIINNLIHRLI